MDDIDLMAVATDHSSATFAFVATFDDVRRIAIALPEVTLPR